MRAGFTTEERARTPVLRLNIAAKVYVLLGFGKNLTHLQPALLSKASCRSHDLTY
jgi:hypothetical protein